MTKTSKYILQLLSLFLPCMLLAAGVQAGEEVKINTIFEKYGKQKGSTMVVLSGKSLHDYRLDKYQGITLKYDKDILDEIQRCLESDKKQARQIKEVISNGIITSGYYQLTEEESPVNRYILFKIGDDGTATLIYMEGGQESEELVNRLFIKEK